GSRLQRGHLGVMRLITGENSAGTGSFVSGTRATPPPRRVWVSTPRGARRHPAAMTDLDVTAAGISLPVGEPWHRLCSGGLVAWTTRPGRRHGVETGEREVPGTERASGPESDSCCCT